MISGMRVLVLGTGVAGTSAVAACNELGAIPTTVDANGSADYVTVAELDLSAYDVAMASAAFAPHSEAILACQAAGLEIWSEMEFAWRVRRPDIPWVLVTGTNGKTTTTQMVGAIAAAGGLDVRVCGNMGIPVIEAARAHCDLVAVEIASLQLHFTHTLSPHAAVCLNADDDHTEWHGSLEAYHADKARVFRHVRVACVYPAGEPHIERMVEEADVVDGCRAVGITLGVPAVSQLGVVESHLVDRAFHDARRTEAVELASVADLAHLVASDVPPYLAFNALAAAALCRAVGVEPAAVREGLAGFSLDHHRSAFVATKGGVTYVDDSKATNAHAVRAALGGYGPASVVWIAGGLAKGQDFGDLVREIHGKVAAVVLIGVDQDPLARALAEHAADIPVVAIAPGETVMERAVEAARSLASAGQTVLLSPASASMDQFRDYADRGNVFAAKVRALED